MCVGGLEEQGADQPTKRADHVPVGIARPRNPAILAIWLERGCEIEGMICSHESIVADGPRRDKSPSLALSAVSESEKGRPQRSRPFPSTGASRHPRKSFRSLLELDGAAGFLDLLLDLLGLVLADAFLERLRSAFDERLRFAQAQAGDHANFLDHVDLLAAVAGENDVELGLFFGSRGGSRGSRSSRNGSRGGYAPLLFEGLG